MARRALKWKLRIVVTRFSSYGDVAWQWFERKREVDEPIDPFHPVPERSQMNTWGEEVDVSDVNSSETSPTKKRSDKMALASTLNNPKVAIRCETNSSVPRHGRVRRGRE